MLFTNRDSGRFLRGFKKQCQPLERSGTRRMKPTIPLPRKFDSMDVASRIDCANSVISQVSTRTLRAAVFVLFLLLTACEVAFSPCSLGGSAMSILDLRLQSDLVHDAEKSLQSLKNLIGAINLKDILAVMFCAHQFELRSKWFDENWQHAVDVRIARDRAKEVSL